MSLSASLLDGRVRDEQNQDSTMADTQDPPLVNFDMEFYKLHRAHELALTNAEASLEQSLLRFYFLFNAGSLGAFIAFVQANWKEFEQDTTFSYRAISAMLIWATGVLFSFAATFLWYRGQMAYTEAYRFRRQAMEADYGSLTSDPIWHEKFGIELKDRADASNPRTVAERLRNKADARRSYGRVWIKIANCIGYFSIVLAFVGFITALWTMFGERPHRVVEVDPPSRLAEVISPGQGIELRPSICLLRCPSPLQEK